MSEHNRWLDFKIRHGFAVRGHTGGTMGPKGLVSGIVYKLFFKHRAPEQPEVAKVFHKSVGGTLGPVGKTNGE